ncbi:LysR family transcriptional regulator [Anderseniella sp. Alg231-50]|uniref:LysR family transcriptional regulator n=1 Tax=Anderseniella sp. Alg231-50 TaxID=1922226 RepID=UPI000D561DB6
MNLSELRTFLTIIETGSLVRASQQLNVTQSTVTARLNSLENELGQVLINRQKSGASLTGAGVRLQRYANTISDLWRQARQQTALPDAMSSVCNLASHPDLWPHLGTRMFDYIRANHSQVALAVWHGSQADMHDWLGNGLTDISLTYWPNSNQKQVVYPIATDQLVLVSTRKDSPIKFDPGYIFVEAGEEFGQQHAEAYADADIARISFGSAQLGLEHLLINGGSAYLPLRMVKPHIADGRLFRLAEGPVFERNAFMVVNKSALETWPWFDDCLNDLMSDDDDA